MPYTIEQFATEIKAKHPEYQTWDNKYLAAQVVDKHPEYREWVTKDDSIALHKVARSAAADELAKNFKPAQETAPDTSGPLGFLKARANNLNDALTRGETGQQTSAETGFQAFGNMVAGPAMDVLGKVLSPIDKAKSAVLNQGAGRVANILTGKGNTPTPQSQTDISTVTNKLSPRTQANLGSLSDILQAGMTVAGAEHPKVTQEAGAAKTRLAEAKSVKTAVKADTVAGDIVQGGLQDKAPAKNALSGIDTTKVKTYKDLETQLATKEKQLVESKGKALSTSKDAYKLKDLNANVEGTSHNFVQDALNQLDTYYKKTNNVKGQAAMKTLRTKAETSGLTVKEIDDLAVKHGQDLNGYNANGQLASGLTKQAAENTRAGIKTTARDLFGNDAYQAVDSQLSDTIRTRSLVKDITEEVNKLQQKIQKRSLGEKAGRAIAKVVNLVSGGTAKGFVESFLGRGTGLKTLNALDLEATLQKNLKLLQEAAGPNVSEATVVKNLEQILKDNQGKPEPIAKGQSTKSTVVPDTLKRFTPDPNKPIQVNNYQTSFPKYITPDQIKAQTKILRYKDNAGRSMDIIRKNKK